MATNNLFAKKPTNQMAAGIRIRSEPSLLRAPLNLRTVYAGDLITAQYFNDLVETILGLEQRVVELESRCYATLKITAVKVGYDDFRFLFDVTGSGLDPENLATFRVKAGNLRMTGNLEEFEEDIQPINLAGDDQHITFAVGRLLDFDLASQALRLTAAQRAARWKQVKLELDNAFADQLVEVVFTLEIENKAGATASRGFTIGPSDPALG